MDKVQDSLTVMAADVLQIKRVTHTTVATQAMADFLEVAEATVEWCLFTN
jgi:hypothetical protein